MVLFRKSGIAAAMAGLVLLAGCGVQRPGSSAVPDATAGVTGRVHGGQQAVGGSTIQLYTVGTTGDGSSSTALLTQTVTTDGNGNFSLTGLYSCTSATLVYITATGGDPTPTTTNPNLAMMTALGACTGLTSGTFISINEVTTVAAVAALSPYMTSATAIGSGTSDVAALTAAFATAAAYADPSLGVTPGPDVPAGMAAPSSEINTLADILASCVNSTGGASGDNSSCGNLFLLTKPGTTAPTNTIAALLNLANNPTLNTSSLFGLASTVAPFQPGLSVTPNDFSVFLSPTSVLLNPSSLTFASTPVGGTVTQTGTVANGSSGAVTLSGISITGINSGDFAETNNCPSSLASGTLCTVTVSFTPLAASSRSASFGVTAGGTTSTIALSGTGTTSGTGPVTLSPTSLAFYDVNVPQVLTLTNYGSTQVGISAINISPSEFTQTNNCGSALAAQSVCNIYVSVNTTYGSTLTGTLMVVDSDTTDAQTASLTSYTRSASTAKYLQGESVGSVNTSNYAEFEGGVYYGTGAGYSLYEYQTTLTGPDASDFVVDTNMGNDPCYTYGSPGCYIYYNFAPKAQGWRSTTVVDNGGVYNYMFALGVGTTKGFLLSSAADGLLPGAAFSFGSVSEGSSANLTGMVYNDSTSNLTFNSNAVTFSTGSANSGDFSGSVTSCGVPLYVSPSNITGTPGECTLSVTFSPQAVGTRYATLTVTEASGLTQTLFVSGTGLYAAPVVPSVAFGSVAVGVTSATQLATATMPSSHAAIAMIFPSGSEFSLPGAVSCEPGVALCQFGVNFTPTTTGAASAELIVTDAVSGKSATAQLTGTGGAPLAPLVSLSPTSITFALRSAGTTSIPVPVTLTNTGTAALTVSGISVVGAVSGNFMQTNNCTTVAVGLTCTIEVTFAPTVTGAQSATVQILSNAASSPNTVPVSGTAD